MVGTLNLCARTIIAKYVKNCKLFLCNASMFVPKFKLIGWFCDHYCKTSRQIIMQADNTKKFFSLQLRGLAETLNIIDRKIYG